MVHHREVTTRGIARLGAPDATDPTPEGALVAVSVSAPGPSQDVRPVRRALVSVYDKTGLDDLVRGLHDAGVTLVSTGGSAALIESLGLPVDPTLHRAMQAVPANGEAPGPRVAELRRGDTAGGRVLRHAEVAVAAELAREAP